MDAQALADSLLNEGISLDGGRPSDDISVLVVSIVPSEVASDRELVRRMNVSFPSALRMVRSSRGLP